MKTWIEKKIVDFVKYTKNVKNYSDTTKKTYLINLEEAIKYIDIEKKGEIIYIDLMPYRIYIKNKARKTIYKKISIFRSFIRYLKKDNIEIKLNNDDNISTSKTLPKPISHEYIVDAIQRTVLKDKLLIQIIYTLGLRISEVENLKLEDIKNGWVIIKGKGGKIRQLPLVKSVQELLVEFLQEQRPSTYLFEKDGKRLSSMQLRYRLSKVFKDIGLKVTPHQLRHSFATELLKNGAAISDVSKLLGHSSLESTQIYTKLTSSQKSLNYNKAHPLAKMGEKFV